LRECTLIKEWELNDIEVKTNIGTQKINLKCELFKYVISNKDITLFEKYILGHKNYYYIIGCTPNNPIRENRDCDLLEAFNEDGNDAIDYFSMGIGNLRRNDTLDITDSSLNLRIKNYLSDFDPEIKKANYKEREKNKKWTNKTLFSLHCNHYKEEIELYTCIYPFHGHDLSGYTDLISFNISNDDENGLGLNIALLGFHLYVHSCSLTRFIQKRLFKPYRWNTDNEEYHVFIKKYREWSKQHRISHIFNKDWEIKVGINRVYGFFFRKEFDDSSKGTQYFNPLRNKLWNLI
jgi:hypothetical protein